MRKGFAGVVLLVAAGFCGTVRAETEMAHKPPEYFVPGYRIDLKLDARDQEGIDLVRCYFKAADNQDFVFVRMTSNTKDVYSAVLPAPSPTTKRVEYRFLALNKAKAVVKSQTFSISRGDTNVPPAWQGQDASSGDLNVSTELPEAPKSVAGFTDSVAMGAVDKTTWFLAAATAISAGPELGAVTAPAVAQTGAAAAPAVVQAAKGMAHKQPAYFIPGFRIDLKLTAKDPAGIDLVRCYFKAAGDKDFVFVKMTANATDVYSAVLPAPSPTTKSIEYLFLAVNKSKEVVKSQSFVIDRSDTSVPPAWQSQGASSGNLNVYTELPEAPKTVAGFTDSVAMDAVASAERFLATSTLVFVGFEIGDTAKSGHLVWPWIVGGGVAVGAGAVAAVVASGSAN